MSSNYDRKYIKKNRKKISTSFDKYYHLKGIRFQAKRLYDVLRVHYYYKRIIFKYLNDLNPKAILSTSDMTESDRILILWCKKRDIPYFILQPSFYKPLDQEKFNWLHKIKYFIVNRVLKIPLYRYQNIYGNEYSNTILFLWSKYFAKNLDKKELFFKGNPAFDKIFKKFSQRKKIRNNVLICTQDIDQVYSENEFERIISMYKKTFQDMKGITFYLKVHPRESKKKYEKIFNDNKFSNIKIIKNQDLYDIFKKCDAQISYSSFTSFEAAAVGLPIITIKPKNFSESFNFFNGEININVTNSTELISAIKKTLSHEYYKTFLKKRKKYFKRMLHSTDGLSSQRISQKIKQLIKLYWN